MLSWAYAWPYIVSPLKNKISHGSDSDEESKPELIHRIVAVDNKHVCFIERFDTLTVCAGNEQNIFTCKKSRFPLWFAEVFACTRINESMQKKQIVVLIKGQTVLLVNPIEATRWLSFNYMKYWSILFPSVKLVGSSNTQRWGGQ